MKPLDYELSHVFYFSLLSNKFSQIHKLSKNNLFYCMEIVNMFLICKNR